MKWYGSIDNRLAENRQFVDEIKVGTGVTEYFWSDRHAYEVIKVVDQKHITIREYDHKNIGGAYSNNWELISNPENAEYDLVKRGKYWYTTATCRKEDIIDYLDEDNKFVDFDMWRWFMNWDFDLETVLTKGKQTKYIRKNISIGVASYYYDYEF